MSQNLALLSDTERYKIELSKQAAFLIHEMRIGKINRSEIKARINSEPEETRDYFKLQLNRYLDMR